MNSLVLRIKLRRRDLAIVAGRRLAFLLPLLVLVTLGVFGLAAISPFDPLDAYTGGRAGELSVTQQAQLTAQLRLDLPWYEAWFEWIRDIARGDLGISRAYHQPVVQVLEDRLPWTLLLGSAGFALSVALSLGLGVWAGLRPRGAVDTLISTLSVTMQATPPFVVALAALAIFALTLNWVPTGGLTYPGQPITFASTVIHLLMPGFVLALTQMPWLVLSLRESIAEAITSDAVRGARLRGIPPRRIVWRHVLPIALPPFVALVGARLSELIAGSVLIETIFAWPGLGTALVRSAQSLDFPLLTFLTVAATALVLIGNLLADLVFVILDPRVDADA
ncbi:ABC transporter permease [Rhizobium helianthi]|uniref:ABC transporter permease n=1 Tax=Rhizobium helianthi TaxID=1132695 RepID=A0ABW4M0C0_9HYPH